MRDGAAGDARKERPALSSGSDDQVVDLAEVQVRVVQRGDLAGVVEELVRVIAVAAAEAPAVGDIGDTVTAVVDLDVVAQVVAERVEVRAAVGLLHRNPVRHHGDGVGLVGAGERVHVGVVRPRVPGDQGRLTVAGGHAETRGEGHRSQSCGQRGGTEHEQGLVQDATRTGPGL